MTHDEEISLLSQLPVFQSLDEEALRILVFSTDVKEVRTSEVVFRRADRSDAGYLVLSGSIALYREPESGTIAATAGVGSLLGEMALIAATEYQVTAVAREPTSLLRIPRVLFQRILREYPGSAARLRAVVENRLLSFTADLQKIRE